MKIFTIVVKTVHNNAIILLRTKSITYRTTSIIMLLYVLSQPAGLSQRSGYQRFPLTHSTISTTPGFYFHSRKHKENRSKRTS